MKTFEYKNIDIEARRRMQNLIFRAIEETTRDENCVQILTVFLSDNLGRNTSCIYIQIYHILGYASRGKAMPIIACFRDHPLINEILKLGHKLKKQRFSPRNCPNNITNLVTFKSEETKFPQPTVRLSLHRATYC